jgi:hypothetical protein
MQSKAVTVEQYLKELPTERKEIIKSLRDLFKNNLPKGFEERMEYGMISFVIPHSIYPEGYHCDPKKGVPFISIASQKNAITIYHMGMYSDSELLNWFQSEWVKHSTKKLDMGKSCIRFKKSEDVPLKLITSLAKKITVKKWIDTYEKVLKK